MYCTQCGKALPENAQFCAQCGTPVPDAQSRASVIQNAAQNEGTAQEKHTRARQAFGDPRAQQDRKAPPKVSLLTIFLAILGLVLILVLLDPWHTGKERPADFKGSMGQSEQVKPSTVLEKHVFNWDPDGRQSL